MRCGRAAERWPVCHSHRGGGGRGDRAGRAAGGGAGESAGGGAAAQRSVAAQREKRGGFATLRVLLRTEGPAALFRGLSASLAKQVPAVGSAFFVFGEAKRWLAARHE